MERLKQMSKIKKILLIIFLILLIFTRFYNLPSTSRFTRDESSNLVDMHRIYVQKELTLVGPVDVANYIIYPSLTYYMLLPFAVLGHFTTYSPAYGTAFFGVLSVLLIIYLTKKTNKKFLIPISILLLVWYPLVESARWAWNPHLVPFISVLTLIFWQIKNKWTKFVSGIFFGLTFHLHYFTLVSSGVFLALSSLLLLKEKKFKEIILTALGFIVAIIPFVIFDLKNPPGLFFGRFLHNNLVTQSFSEKVSHLISTIPANIYQSVFYLTQTPFLAILAGAIIISLLVIDIKSKSKALIYFLPFIAQIAAISFLPYFAVRYVLLAIVFFTIWIIFPRKKWGTRLSLLLVGIMILGSLLNINRLLTKPQIEPGALIVEKAGEIMAQDIKSLDLKNVNIAILDSPDPDPLGITYRHTLLVKEVRILSDLQYDITDNLFAVSTSSVDVVRKDPASIINRFRNGRLVKEENITGTNWKVYLFNR